MIYNIILKFDILKYNLQLQLNEVPTKEWAIKEIIKFNKLPEYGKPLSHIQNVVLPYFPDKIMYSKQITNTKKLDIKNMPMLYVLYITN